MTSLPDDLRRGLDKELGGIPIRQLTSSVQRLIEVYRQHGTPSAPTLRSNIDVLAYAAYRMPATYAAVRAALGQVAEADQDFRPSTQIDLGGGTGAAIWAAADVWPSLSSARVVEQMPEVLALGRRLGKAATAPSVSTASWLTADINSKTQLLSADVVTMSYVLGELPTAQRRALVDQLAACGGLVVLVEPGTPAGYERVIEARDRMIGCGLTIIAPCPHDRSCPIPRGKDWCHFSARVNRSSLHRAIKGATLGHEDEKFSYVAAASVSDTRAASRVLRHPEQRKGLVSLRLCTDRGELESANVSKRQGDLYRAARHAQWGDVWPPLN